MDNKPVRFACDGCGICCKGRLIPLTLDEARQWLDRGDDVAVILEAFDESTWAHAGQYEHSAKRAVQVHSGTAQIQVVAVLAGNALQQCPSLGEDNRCGIYDVRPLVCRIYPMEINPFIPLNPKDKICPPEVWESGEILYTDRIVSPVLEDQVQRSRQADRDDALAKIAVCAAMGLTVAAWKGNAMAVYLPEHGLLQQAIRDVDSGAQLPANVNWTVRVEDVELRQKLQRTGVELDTGVQGGYIFHAL